MEEAQPTRYEAALGLSISALFESLSLVSWCRRQSADQQCISGRPDQPDMPALQETVRFAVKGLRQLAALVDRAADISTRLEQQVKPHPIRNACKGVGL